MRSYFKHGRADTGLQPLILSRHDLGLDGPSFNSDGTLFIHLINRLFIDFIITRGESVGEGEGIED
jgi:hypothetical protein